MFLFSATSFAYQVCQLRVIAGIPNALYYDSERVMGESIQVKSAIKTTIHQEFNSKKYVKNNIAIIEVICAILSKLKKNVLSVLQLINTINS